MGRQTEILHPMFWRMSANDCSHAKSLSSAHDFLTAGGIGAPLAQHGTRGGAGA